MAHQYFAICLPPSVLHAINAMEASLGALDHVLEIGGETALKEIHAPPRVRDT